MHASVRAVFWASPMEKKEGEGRGGKEMRWFDNLSNLLPCILGGCSGLCNPSNISPYPLPTPSLGGEGGGRRRKGEEKEGGRSSASIFDVFSALGSSLEQNDTRKAFLSSFFKRERCQKKSEPPLDS